MMSSTKKTAQRKLNHNPRRPVCLGQVHWVMGHKVILCGRIVDFFGDNGVVFADTAGNEFECAREDVLLTRGDLMRAVEELCAA